MKTIFVTDVPETTTLLARELDVVGARDYLTDVEHGVHAAARVVNLCRTYSFQTLGYYVSLLAAARGHHPLPSVATLQDLRLPDVIRVVADELDEMVINALRAVNGDRYTMRVYAGRCAAGHRRLAHTLWRRFPAPLLNAHYQRESEGEWRLSGLGALPASEIPADELEFATESLLRLGKESPSAAVGELPPAARFDLAILWDTDERDRPSDERAINKFVRAARDAGMNAEVIDRTDYARLGEYDALFLRQTTAVDHHTYRFARRAEFLGLVVMDSPEAIVRATNKVFQAEIFARHGVSVPATRVLHRDNSAEVLNELGLPIVLKWPDSSFSQGVKKATTEAEYDTLRRAAIESSDLIVAQEYTPSDFDWRIGVLGGEFLFACRYHMAPGHWQIQRTGARGWRRYGAVDAVARADVPAEAIDLGQRAARLFGDGLFGVDVKEVDGRFLVVEVNDNPNVDAGCEDGILGDALYAQIMGWFLTRLEARGR